ncbi:unnamed protein product [Fusarium fujikuroi]|nr:unnamed protein product [Fusarium fujikuroi]
MQRHAAYTCQEVGLCMEKIQDCVGYYGEKTETSTWDRYTGQASPSYLHDFDRAIWLACLVSPKAARVQAKTL